MELQPVYIHVICVMGHSVRMRSGSRCTHCVHGLTAGLTIRTDMPINLSVPEFFFLILAHTGDKM
jgi:hypothetical protein